MGKREPLSEEWFEALDALHESERSRRWRLRMGKPEFTREGLERWAARRSDDAGRLFTFCLSLMDELYETRGSALDTHKKYLAVQLERCKDVDALRGAMSIAFAFGPKDARTAKARRLYTHPHMEQARARIAAWDKENHDG